MSDQTDSDDDSLSPRARIRIAGLILNVLGFGIMVLGWYADSDFFEETGLFIFLSGPIVILIGYFFGYWDEN